MLLLTLAESIYENKNFLTYLLMYSKTNEERNKKIKKFFNF